MCVSFTNQVAPGTFFEVCFNLNVKFLSNSSAEDFTEVQDILFERPESWQHFLFNDICLQIMTSCSKTSVKIPDVGNPIQFLRKKNLWKSLPSKCHSSLANRGYFAKSYIIEKIALIFYNNSLIFL